MKAFIVPTTLEFNMWEEDVRIIGVEMKSFNTNRTDNGEGKPLCICTLMIIKKDRYILCKYRV